MAVKPGILGLGLFILGAIVVGTAEGGKGNGGRSPVGPIPVPTTDAHLAIVNAKICDCWVALGQPTNPAALRACAAETLHPDVPWPPVPGDHASVHQVWSLISSQVGAFMASPDKAAWCSGPEGPVEPADPGGPSPLDVLNEILHQSPTDGGFYIVGSDPELGDSKDSLSRIARAALNAAVPGAGDSAQMRMEYIHCITMGDRWNYPTYASSSFSSQFPSMYGVQGMGLRRAFYPYHEDARQAVLEQRMPTRGITSPAGAKLSGVGNSYAMLWLPPLDKDAIAQGIFTCGTIGWSDGSSGINPPPEFLEMVGG